MDEKKSCRWGLLVRQASVIGRFKNKLRLKKLEWKKFYEQMWGPPPATPGESGTEWADSNQSHSNHEGSCSSHYNSQYYDSSLTLREELLELSQQGYLTHQDSVNMPQPTTPAMEHLDSFDSNHPLSVNEYLDLGQIIDSPHVGESMDTGTHSMPLRPEDRLQWFKQFFDVGAEEALQQPHQGSTGRGWRVMVRIVCACRKLSKMLRMRRMERTQSGEMVRKRSRGFGENRSQLYKGVRRRNGKWVSEIRVGQTSEKVWLGSYDTEKEAALAFDAGKYYCSAKRCRSFNFPDSPRLLGPPINLKDLTPKERKKKIQRLAEDHAKDHDKI